MIREALFVVAGAGAVAAVALVVTAPDPTSPCGYGFRAFGSRCCVSAVCNRASSCPTPLASGGGDRCVAPDARVMVPETTVVVGPSDWEAEGRVAPRSLHTRRFAIDAFELSDDDARAKGGLSRDEALALCNQKGGRLPTDDEWTVAAAGAQPRRYPWGETGAVCRRGAWGLQNGPCTHGATGPDTVGAHADGDTPSGIHDMAGNVAEWVSDGDGIVRGGSYRSSLATEMRTWSRVEVPASSHEPWVGARCAYDLQD